MRASVKLIILILIFLIPILAATYLYQSNWRPAHTLNYGTLITPPVSMTLIQDNLETAQDLQLFSSGKWTFLALLHNHGCDEACAFAHHQLKQIQTALGKNSERLQRVVLFEQQNPSLESQPIPIKVSDLDAIERKLHTLSLLNDPNQVWLVDPNGNIMMVYSGKDLNSSVLKDLERLMKYSEAGSK